MSRSDAARATPLDRYLSRLEAELSAVPPSEREEILRETRSHVLERTRRTPSRTAEQVLAELGPANDYARRFLSEVQPAPSPPRQGTLRRFARLVTGGVARIPLFAVVLMGYAVAVGIAAIALWKLVEPDATGLFIRDLGGGRRAVSVVVSDPYQGGRDVLGYWLVPLGLGVALCIHLGIAALLRRLLPDDARLQ